MFIAEGCEEVEALTVVDLLRRVSIICDMVSITDSPIVTSSHGVVLTCDQLLADVDVAAYDMLVLPGGLPGTPNLAACPALTGQIKARAEAGGRVAAICAAPSILAELGILEGRRATSNPAFQHVLTEHGAQLTEGTVVVDANLITSMGMGTAIDFGLAIVRHFLGEDAVADLRTKIVCPA